MPHGYGYMWNPGLRVAARDFRRTDRSRLFHDSFTLLWLVRKRRDLPFNWIVVLFGVFIVACGGTHIMEIWNLWHAEYWLAGVLKAVTAAASVATQLLLVQLAPRRRSCRTSARWIQADPALENEVHERRELEIDLRISEARTAKCGTPQPTSPRARTTVNHELRILRLLRFRTICVSRAAR